MKRISIEELKNFCRKALIQAGYREEDAVIVSEVLATTDAFGVQSHGTKNLYEYILKGQAGGLNRDAVPEIIREGPAWALMDAHAAMGMIGAARGMLLAIEKARTCGVAYVAVENSCHFGAAGYYANLAAKEGMIGIAMSNADPTMTIPGGRGISIGNNPFSYAAPLPDGRSVFLDIALSSVAALKVVLAKADHQPVPDTWLVDSEGKVTRDASGFPEGSHLQPMAGHKGYGLAVMVEILTSVITGMGLLSEVRSWNRSLSEKNLVNHAFIVIDTKQMFPDGEFTTRMERLARELHNTEPAVGNDRIFLPGEMEWEKLERAEKEGIPVSDAMEAQLIKLSEMTGIPVPWMPEEASGT